MLSGQYDFGAGDGSVQDPLRAGLHVVDPDPVAAVAGVAEHEQLLGLPAVMEGANGTKVLVGPENVADELKDTSVVMTKFDIGDGMQGMIGVVGPTRMDYAKVTARLSYFAESLSKMFGKPEQPQQPKLPERTF